jgi:hypothetical protein
MKRLAFLSFAIATLIAPIQVQAQEIQVQAQERCVSFPQPSNPEAELRYLLSHPGARVCASPQPNAAGQMLQQGATDRAIASQRLMRAMSGASGPGPAAADVGKPAAGSGGSELSSIERR